MKPNATFCIPVKVSILALTCYYYLLSIIFTMSELFILKHNCADLFYTTYDRPLSTLELRLFRICFAIQFLFGFFSVFCLQL